jgi:hypothetical protein
MSAVIAALVLAVFISTLALSTYGLGREEKDKMSVGYQAASAFTMISVSGTIISLFVLIYFILTTKSVTDRFVMTKAQ